MDHEAEAAEAVGDGVEGQLLAAALHEEAERGFRVGLDRLADRLVVGKVHVAHRHDAVAHLETGHLGPALGADLGDFTRVEQREWTAHALVDEDLAEFLVQGEGHFFAVAEQVDFGDPLVEALHAQVAVVLQGAPVVAEDAVAVLEAEVLQDGVDVDGVDVGQFGLAPGVEDAGVNHEAQDEVDDDAAKHDDQPLPSGLRPKLPRLRRLGHLLGVHALVDHAGDFHVAAQGQPPDAPLGLANLLFEEGEPGVHEEVKLLHAGLEGAGGPVVAELVEHHEDGQAQQELGGFDQSNHGFKGTRPLPRVEAIHAPLLTTNPKASELGPLRVQLGVHEAHSVDVVVVGGRHGAVARIGRTRGHGAHGRLARNRGTGQPQNRLRHPRLLHRRKGPGPVLHREPFGRPLRSPAAPPRGRPDQHRGRAFLRARRHRFHWFGSGDRLHGQARRRVHRHPAAGQAPVHRQVRDHQFLRAGCAPKAQGVDHRHPFGAALHETGNRGLVLQPLRLHQPSRGGGERRERVLQQIRVRPQRPGVGDAGGHAQEQRAVQPLAPAGIGAEPSQRGVGPNGQIRPS